MQEAQDFDKKIGKDIRGRLFSQDAEQYLPIPGGSPGALAVSADRVFFTP